MFEMLESFLPAEVGREVYIMFPERSYRQLLPALQQPHVAAREVQWMAGYREWFVLVGLARRKPCGHTSVFCSCR